MAALADRLGALRAAIAESCGQSGRPVGSVALVAVSKLQPASAIVEAMHAGQRDFGENYAQELRDKQKELMGEAGLSAVRWHFIGPLQRNKVHLVVGRVGLIHSVDSRELVEALAARAAKSGPLPGEGLVQDCLVQVNIARETQKAGCPPAELPALLDLISGTGTLRCRGLMCLPPDAPDAEASRPYFRRLRELRDDLAQTARPRVELVELSMGMSHDFGVAIEEGATLIRVGTAIFGARQAH